MSSGLVKIPFILASALCTHVNWTAPNPPPKAEEQAKYDGVKGWIERGPLNIPHIVSLCKKLVYLTDVLEVLAILAAASKQDPTLFSSLPFYSFLRTLPVPDTLLTYLARIGLHISLPSSFLTSFAVAASGTIIRYAAIRWLGRLFTYQLAVRKDHELVTSGPYNVVRHPSYTGGQIFLIGVFGMQAGPGSFWRAVRLLGGTGQTVATAATATYMLLFTWLYGSVFPRVSQEDAVLKAEFGDQWKAWAKRTSYRLYPLIW